MASSKPRPESSVTQEGKDSAKNQRILRIIDKLKNNVPTQEDMDEWASTEPPEPLFGDLAFQEKKKKPWLL